MTDDIRIPSHVKAISGAAIDVINSRATMLRRDGFHVIPLGQAVPGFPPPECAIEAARRSLGLPNTNLYSADAGLSSLREALCEQLDRHHAVRADPENEVIITAGGNQAFMLALLTLLEPGDEVLLPAPYFMNHEMAVRATHAIPVEVPLNPDTGFQLRFEDVAPHITPRTKAVVCVNPSNPTGAVAEPTELQRLVAALAATGICVISDETYTHFVYGPPAHQSLAALPDWRSNVVVTNSFSKSFAITGWRVGYLLGPREMIEQAIKIQDSMIICATVIAQRAVEAAIRQAWDYPLQYLDDLNARRCYLARRIATIPGLRWVPTRGGFFAFVQVEGCVDSFRLALDVLDSAHVAMIPGILFGRSGEGFVRLSYGSVSMADLEQACDRLERFFTQRSEQASRRELQ